MGASQRWTRGRGGTPRIMTDALVAPLIHFGTGPTQLAWLSDSSSTNLDHQCDNQKTLRAGFAMVMEADDVAAAQSSSGRWEISVKRRWGIAQSTDEGPETATITCNLSIETRKYGTKLSVNRVK